MAEHTAGQYPGAGNGPETGSVLVGRSAESPERSAWRAYLVHRPGCFQCINTPVLCPTGRRLWDAYKTASQ